MNEAVSERPIVYIREVAVADLPENVQEQAGELDTLFAIGSEDGTRLALVADRQMAFAVARQNGTVPHSVH